MGERRPQGGSRQAGQPRHAHYKTCSEQSGALGDFGQAAEDKPGAEPQSQGGQDPASALQGVSQHDRGQRAQHRNAKPLRRPRQIAAFPGEHRPEGDGEEQGDHQGDEGQFKKRRADGDFASSHSFQGQG
jgi:hypothetical protein